MFLLMRCRALATVLLLAIAWLIPARASQPRALAPDTQSPRLDDSVSSRASRAWDLPPGVPPPGVPDMAALSPARIELGRRLFYDQRLSVTGTYACAACHQQAFAFTDARPVAIGATGQKHARSSMSLVNVAYRETLTWANPTLTSLEQQALVPMFGDEPIELGLKGRDALVYARLAEDQHYTRLFSEAFPGDDPRISTETVTAALAAFERSIVSFRSAYDRYKFHDDPSAYSPAARRGGALFGGRLGCMRCHSDINFDGGLRTAAGADAPVFHNTGLMLMYRAPNTGLQAHSGKAADEGRFRAPTLRNIARTAPYMHDGSIATLDAVIDHYAAGGRAAHPNRSRMLRPFTLTAEERADLLAFLDSLTDWDALMDSRWSDPWRTNW